MGKGRNKNKEKDYAPGTSGTKPKQTARQTDYSDSDCESESTHLTFDDDLRSVRGEIEDIEDSSFIDSLSEHIENATHKNISVRLAALRHLQFALTGHYLYDFTSRYKATLVDLTTKAIKKTDEEIIVGAQLLALVAIHVGDEVSSEVEEPLLLLCQIVSDAVRTVGVRSMAALSIALTSHLSCESDDLIAKCTKALHDTWTSFKSRADGGHVHAFLRLNGDFHRHRSRHLKALTTLGDSQFERKLIELHSLNKEQKVGSQYTHLFCSSLSSWCLMLENIDGRLLMQSLNDQARLVAFVEGSQLDMRVSAGEALAFLYELAAQVHPGHKFANHEHLVQILHGLVSDSAKSKTKRDKRIQKFTFRQIFACVVDGESPSLSIKFNKENLLLNSCSYKLLYDLCCELLRGGMMHQLKDNTLLRQLFDLGPPPEEKEEKIAKQSRMHIQNSINKIRDQQRAKQRDKRTC